MKLKVRRRTNGKRNELKKLESVEPDWKKQNQQNRDEKTESVEHDWKSQIESWVEVGIVK